VSREIRQRRQSIGHRHDFPGQPAPCNILGTSRNRGSMSATLNLSPDVGSGSSTKSTLKLAKFSATLAKSFRQVSTTRKTAQSFGSNDFGEMRES
jgi:hypothetical protein